MNYSLIIRPLIGAGIGYVTNWIAVKMMFRPLNEIRIGKIKVPFTPGLIPKNKERIAESIGNAINEHLLTEETLKTTLLSEEIKNQVREKIIDYSNNLSENDLALKDYLYNFIDEKDLNNTINSLIVYITNSIYDTLLKANLGDIVAREIELSASEKIKGSILGVLGGNAIISSIAENTSMKVNNYVKNNGKELIYNMVTTEVSKYFNKHLSDYKNDLDNYNLDLVSIVIKIYEDFVINKLSNILLIINIPKIVKDKINSMDTLELEKYY